MSQTELAELTGLKGPYLSDYETGKSLPTPEREAIIAEALGWTRYVQDALEDLEAALDEG